MFKNFSAKNVAKIGVFTALAYVISFIEIPLFPSAPFLKLDFSNVFILIGGFYLGPISGIIIIILKELLCFLVSSTMGVGQIANVLVGAIYILIPTISYHYKRSFKCVIISLSCAILFHIAGGLFVNKFITFPLYGLPDSAFNEFFFIIIAFNFIKAFLVGLVTVLLYKKVKKLLD